MRETWVLSLGWEDPWGKAWQPAPVFLPGESHGTTERLSTHIFSSLKGLAFQEGCYYLSFCVPIGIICCWLILEARHRMKLFTCFWKSKRATIVLMSLFFRLNHPERKVKSLSRVPLFGTPWILCLWDSPDKSTGVGCISFNRGSSWARDRTRVCCIGRCVLTTQPAPRAFNNHISSSL